MSAIDDLIEFMRSFESDHLPDGWPAVRMQQITMLLNEIEALRQERDGLRKRDINAIASRICGEIPDDFYIELTLENGAGWVSLFHKNEQVDVDMADWSIAEQFDVTMQCVAELEKEQGDGD